MPRLIILEKDGPLGKAGAQVWVNDDEEPAKKSAPRKSSPHSAKKSAK